MCFQALLIFGETNPLPDPIVAPSVITPITEPLEGVTGDRAAATVKADDRILNLPASGARATPAGKARAARNAFRHGLNVSVLSSNARTHAAPTPPRPFKPLSVRVGTADVMHHPFDFWQSKGSKPRQDCGLRLERCGVSCA
jgi:hypothetical protein